MKIFRRKNFFIKLKKNPNSFGTFSIDGEVSFGENNNYNPSRRNISRQTRKSTKNLSKSIKINSGNLSEGFNLAGNIIGTVFSALGRNQNNRKSYQRQRYAYNTHGNTGIPSAAYYNAKERSGASVNRSFGKQYTAIKSGFEIGASKNRPHYYRTQHGAALNYTGYGNKSRKDRQYQQRYNGHARERRHSRRNDHRGGFLKMFKHFKHSKNKIPFFMRNIMGKMGQHVNNLPNKDRQKMREVAGVFGNFAQQAPQMSQPLSGNEIQNIASFFKEFINFWRVNIQGKSPLKNTSKISEKGIKERMKLFLEKTSLVNFSGYNSPNYIKDMNQGKAKNILKNYMYLGSGNSDKVLNNIFEDFKGNKNKNARGSRKIFLKSIGKSESEIKKIAKSSKNLKDFKKNLKKQNIYNFKNTLQKHFHSESMNILTFIKNSKNPKKSADTINIV